MKKLKLYLETSVWNFLFAEDAPEQRDKTKIFFDEIKEGKYEIYISPLVITEIERTIDKKKRAVLLDTIRKYRPKELTGREDENSELATQYLKNKVVPQKYKDDATHIAIAVVHQMDVMVSWNLRHIVKLATRTKVNGINKLEGYKEIEICTPEEVIEVEE